MNVEFISAESTLALGSPLDSLYPWALVAEIGPATLEHASVPQSER